MSLPATTQDSLSRLRELEKLAASEAPRKAWITWELKSDNLFLLVLIVVLVCLGCLMVMFMHDQRVERKLSEQREILERNPQLLSESLEIPLGEFENITSVSQQPGTVTVLQYETFLATDGSHRQVQETERLVRNRRQRLRSTVETVMMKASEQQLHEPSLNSLRQTLVHQLNDALGSSLVKDVHFAKFMHFQIPDTK